MKEIHRTLGKIEGTLKGMREEQLRQGTAIDSVDTRLRTVEQRSAKTGAIAGGLMSMVLIVGSEFIKKKIGG